MPVLLRAPHAGVFSAIPKCEAALYASLKEAARWREAVAQRFPNDPRNPAAAELLRRLAQAVPLSDGQWTALGPHFDGSSSDALSDTSRAVGMRPDFNDFRAFAGKLIEALAND